MRAQAVAVVAVLVASLSCPRRAPPIPAAPGRDASPWRLLLKTCAPPKPPPAEVATVDAPQAERTRIVRVAKACASSAPTIDPVDSTECQPGFVCLDAKAQATLTRNLASYEAWVRRVIDCESR